MKLSSPSASRLTLLVSIYTAFIMLSIVSKVYAELIFYILLLCVLSQSLNIVFGFAGLVSLGHVVFLGIGSYVFVSMVIQGFNLYLSIIIAGFASLFFALIFGAVLLRLRGVFFACGTLVLALAAPYFIIGTGIVGGFAGINLHKYVGSLYNIHAFTFGLLAISLMLVFLTQKIVSSSYGYSLKAIREDHDAAETTGVNVFRQKLIALCISSIFPGIAGGILALKTTWIIPNMAFDLLRSVEALLAILLGGSGTVMGPILGALIYELLKDVLMGFAPGFQAFVFGILVILIVLRAPEGIIGLLRKNKRLRDILI